MSAKIVDLPTPTPPTKVKPKAPWRAFGAIIIVMFMFGLAMGSCTLGMKLPVALYELAVGHQ